MNKKNLLYGLLGSIAIIAIFYVFQSKKGNVLLSEKEPMRIARYYWPGMFWTDIADKKGWFKEAGLHVEVVDVNADYFGSVTDTASRRIDTNAISVYDLMKFNIKGSPLVAVLASDQSYGADAIVAKKRIKTAQDLKGKRVGVTKGTYAEYLLLKYLQENNMDELDILTVNILAENAEDEFFNNDLDAVVAYEPVISSIIEKGGNKLFDTSNAPEVGMFVYAFHKDFVDERPEDLQKFAEVWKKTLAYMRENPEESNQIIADLYEYPVEDVAGFIAIDRILSVDENKQLFKGDNDQNSLPKIVKDLNTYFKENNLTESQFDPNTLLNSSFVESL